jgi:hypothetical protein
MMQLPPFAMLEPSVSIEDEAVLPASATSLDLLRSVYRDPAQPLHVRMRAAALCLPFEFPKLSVTGTAWLASGFGSRKERLMQSRGISAVIDATAVRKGAD